MAGVLNITKRRGGSTSASGTFYGYHYFNRHHGRLRFGRLPGLPVQFPDFVFQLGAFADRRELFPCCGDLVFLFGRTGNFAATH